MGGSASTTAKQIFLKYYKLNRESLVTTGDTESLWTELLTEINQLPEPSDTGGGRKRCWKDMLPEWTSEVREKLKSSLENE